MIVRVRSSPGGVDQYGDAIASTETRDAVPGAFTSPRMSESMAFQGVGNDRTRAGVVVGLTLFVPYGFDLTHTDQVEVDGVLYSIDGEVGPWRQPMTGWKAGASVALTRAAG